MQTQCIHTRGRAHQLAAKIEALPLTAHSLAIFFVSHMRLPLVVRSFLHM
jgi:hypothetical protein